MTLFRVDVNLHNIILGVLFLTQCELNHRIEILIQQKHFKNDILL